MRAKNEHPKSSTNTKTKDIKVLPEYRNAKENVRVQVCMSFFLLTRVFYASLTYRFYFLVRKHKQGLGYKKRCTVHIIHMEERK